MKVPNFQSASVLQRIGIAPGLVAIVVIVDSLLFGGEASTLGASLLLSIPVGILLAVIAAFWQRKFYGDSWTRAIVKGVVLGILTAIPTPIASIVAIAGAVLPMFQQESEHLDKYIDSTKENNEQNGEENAEASMRNARGKTLS